jgi:hypothetical protein
MTGPPFARPFRRNAGSELYWGGMELSLRSTKVLVAAVLLASAGPMVLPAGDAHALSRGLASKMRRMRDAAFAERFKAATEAFKNGNYAVSAREASLALEHASDLDQASAAHRTLAASYTRLGDPARAAPHQAWLTEHARS